MIQLMVFLIGVALLHAKWEESIEGDAGWAKNLPCWRLSNWISNLVIGKEITGYHVYMLLLFAALFHGAFLFKPWSIRMEFFIWSAYCWYWVIEDFCYFIVHKSFGIKKFKRGCIAWHRRWIIIPVSYWIGILLGLCLYWLGGAL